MSVKTPQSDLILSIDRFSKTREIRQEEDQEPDLPCPNTSLKKFNVSDRKDPTTGEVEISLLYTSFFFWVTWVVVRWEDRNLRDRSDRRGKVENLEEYTMGLKNQHESPSLFHEE